MLRKGLVIFILLSLVGVFSLAAAQDMADPVMEVETNVATVRGFIDEVINAHDPARVDEFLAPGYTSHSPFSAGLPEGPAGFAALATGLNSAFPDVHVTIVDMLVSGDKIVTRHDVAATHQGEFNGIPATDRAVTWTEIHIFRLEEGLIAQHWSEINLAGLLQQLTAE